MLERKIICVRKIRTMDGLQRVFSAVHYRNERKGVDYPYEAYHVAVVYPAVDHGRTKNRQRNLIGGAGVFTDPVDRAIFLARGLESGIYPGGMDGDNPLQVPLGRSRDQRERVVDPCDVKKEMCVMKDRSAEGRVLQISRTFLIGTGQASIAEVSEVSRTAATIS